MSRHSLYSLILALHPMALTPSELPASTPTAHSKLPSSTPTSDPRIRDLSIEWTDYHGEKELGEEGQILTVNDKHGFRGSPPAMNALEGKEPVSNESHLHQPTRSASGSSSTTISPTHEYSPPPALRQTSGITELGPGIIHLYKHGRPLSILEKMEADAVSGAISTSLAESKIKSEIAHLERVTSSDSETSDTELDKVSATLVNSEPETEAEGADGTLIAILAVPSWMSSRVFTMWLSGWVNCLEGYRMINDGSKNKVMVLLKFKDVVEANDFIAVYTGKGFAVIRSGKDESLEVEEQPETCHPIRIHHLIMHRLPAPSASTTSDAQTKPPIPPVPRTPSSGLIPLLTSIPPRTVHELPTCPICLERMDSNITGLITSPCSHVWKCRCLSKWGESDCGVCRYAHRGGLSASSASSTSSTSESIRPASDSMKLLDENDANPPPPPSHNTTSYLTPSSTCSSCPSGLNDPKANWVCVICSSIGCSRYQKGHARDHFLKTGHAYSMEIETQRVWDYMEDNYVHRLIRTRADGKLVELPSAATLATTSSPSSRRGSFYSEKTLPTSPSSHPRLSGNFGPSLSDEKKIARLEDLTLEYSYLLSAQLEQQRAHYEAELSRAKEEVGVLRRKAVEGEGWRKRFVVGEEKWKEVEKRVEIGGAERERLVAIKKAEVATELARKLNSTLESERSLSSGLLTRITTLETLLSTSRESLATSEAKVSELEEMVKDLMFSLEAGGKMKELGEELGEGGDVVVGPGRSVDQGQAHENGDGGSKGKKKKKKR